MKVVFVEVQMLGVLADSAAYLSQHETTKHRKVVFNRVCKGLKGLRLIKDKGLIAGLALGSNSIGQRGLFICLRENDHLTQIQGDANVG